METLSTLLLIRFGLIVGAVVLLALVLFVVALILRRRGRLDAARERVAPVARAVARAAAERYLDAPSSKPRGRDGDDFPTRGRSRR